MMIITGSLKGSAAFAGGAFFFTNETIPDFLE
jgi:hypothetical protein